MPHFTQHGLDDILIFLIRYLKLYKPVSPLHDATSRKHDASPQHTMYGGATSRRLWPSKGWVTRRLEGAISHFSVVWRHAGRFQTLFLQDEDSAAIFLYGYHG